VFSIDSSSIAALEGIRLCLKRRGTGEILASGCKTGRKKTRGKEKGDAEFDSVSKILFIQANRYHSIAASMVSPEEWLLKEQIWL
jgi:hypothetical protein